MSAALPVTRPTKTSVRSVARAARWLLWIAGHDGATATEVSREFDVPLPTVHHVLSTLAQEGLLAKDPARRYHMGPKIGMLSASLMREQSVPSVWQRALAELAASTGETAYLAAWRGGEIRILAGVEGSRAVRVPDIHIGAYAHAHARAAGKLLLAMAPQLQRDAYLSTHPQTGLTDKTITDGLRLEAELERVRERQYATDDEEFADGLACLSVPILEGSTVLGAFSVAAPAQRFRAERPFLLREARRAAADAARCRCERRDTSRSVNVTANAVTGGMSASELGVGFFERMLRTRHLEDEVQRMFTQGLVRGTTHLCQGQEAVSVGVCGALAPGDTMTCTYRGHGAVLAMGAPPDEVFGEIMGKARGLCGGKGGSMHLTDVRVGAYGSFAIVGAHLPITVGLAFASRYLGSDSVSVCFFGDGTTNIGAFHEALNLASVWKAPAIFVCENNRYGEYSPQSLTTPVERLADRAASYAMPGVVVDGNDVFAVHATAGEAVDRARAGLGPTLIEALTYRQVGHSRSDPATYRPEGELDEWLARDPIVLLEQSLIAEGIAPATLEEVRQKVAAEIAAALERAKSWREPTLESRFENVWA